MSMAVPITLPTYPAAGTNLYPAVGSSNGNCRKEHKVKADQEVEDNMQRVDSSVEQENAAVPLYVHIKRLQPWDRPCSKGVFLVADGLAAALLPCMEDGKCARRGV